MTTSIVIPYWNNTSFYGIDLSDDVWDKTVMSSIWFVNSAYTINEEWRKIPIKVSFLNTLWEQERNFEGKVNDIALSGPLYISTMVQCGINNSALIWKTILSNNWLETDYWFMDIETLLSVLYVKSFEEGKYSKRDKIEILDSLSPQRAWITYDEAKELNSHVCFELIDEKNYMVEVMIFMNYFLKKDLYIILPYWKYSWSIVCTSQWLKKYIQSWKLWASLIYKRWQDLWFDFSDVVYEEWMDWFVGYVSGKLNEINDEDTRILSQFFDIIQDATQSFSKAIEVSAKIDWKKWIYWTIKWTTSNISIYKTLEEDLHWYGKISKVIHGWCTVWVEAEKTIKLKK